MAKNNFRMDTIFGKYVLPTVERLDIGVEQGFASSIWDAGSEDYGEMISLEFEEPILDDLIIM